MDGKTTRCKTARGKTPARLGLAAAGLAIVAAGVALDRNKALGQDESETQATTAAPASRKPAAQPERSQPGGADSGAASQGGRGGTTAPAATGSHLKRINTKPLSAGANITLPQDI